METESAQAPIENADPGEVSAVETPAQPEQEPEQKPEKKPDDTPEWARKRFDKLTEQKYQARAEAEQARRYAAELEARLAAYEKPEPREDTAVNPYELAKQIAAQTLQAETFNRAANAAVADGRKEYKGEFETAVKNLQGLGALFDDRGAPTEFAAAVLECDAPHRVLHHLGTNPEEADRLLNLAPRAQARELAKLEMRLSQAPEKKVSSAPGPVRPVGSKTSATDLPLDTDDMTTWMKKRNAQVRASR